MELPLESMVLWLLLALLVAVAALWWRAAGRVGRENQRRQRIAVAGEQAAERLVVGAGFRIVDRQLTRYWDLQVGEEVRQVWCRADLLLERDGLVYIGEVKTGDRAPDPCNPATRRQLLEYRLAFDVDGVLLIDAAAGAMSEVRFPGLLEEP